ncbi:MAG: bifunctional diguanylate cyclase/phosphodiesterase, partial [Mesorhizobium sp.]|nr:bifunctional diguanylate cyclase/phosphodiesterase [Mesorhizobium sp.]
KCASGVLRHGQMLARLGGDEFAIIAPNLPDALAAGRIADAVLAAMHEENRTSPGGALISASIGIALYPLDAEDQTGLISHADTALYRAKTEGRDTYRYFEAAMGAAARDKRVMEHELRQAIARREFRLVYQPQKEINGGRMIGFEALVRWRHPERGDVSPAIFIPVAEDGGIIGQIGDWVLATACEEAARWENPLMVAVNVSAVQLHNPNFVAMDDFGTGYSSLSNLRAFPFDKIKIDASFIKSVDKNGQVAAIVRAVLGLGRGLGLPVLAEGVETLGELDFLNAEACEIGQGYYLGKPSPIEAFGEFTGTTASPAREVAAQGARPRRAAPRLRSV